MRSKKDKTEFARNGESQNPKMRIKKKNKYQK